LKPPTTGVNEYDVVTFGDLNATTVGCFARTHL